MARSQNQRFNAVITIGGVVSATLGRAVATANSQLGNIGRSLGTAQSRIGDAIRRNDAALERSRAGVMDAVGAFYALKSAIAAPVQAAMDFESAMADVIKVVDFPTPKSLLEFRQGLIDLSREVPQTVTGLAEIAAAAGQAGIAGEELVRFTESAAKIGTAFDISAGEAGEGMAKLMTGLGITLDEAISLADAMNHLSNSQASTAAEVLDVVRRVGAQGKQYGFVAEEVAAFGSAMVAAGAQTDVAATSFRNMGRALTRGESATRRQAAAYQTLGLEAGEVAKRMQEDAVSTTVDVMERLAALPKHIQASVSSDLFGDEARALGPLLTNLDLVRESVGMVGDKAQYAGSAFKEFAVRNNVFASRLQRFQNTIQALAITVGEALLPALTQVMDTLTPVIDLTAKFVAQHPDLVANVMLATGAVVAFKGALVALRFVGLLGRGGALSAISIGLRGISLGLVPVVKGLAAARAGMIAFSAAAAIGGIGPALRMVGVAALGLLNPLKLVALAIRGIGMAFAATPIGAIVAGIAAGAYLIYKNWDGVAAWFKTLWGNVTTYFGGFGDFVAGVFTLDVARAWGGLKDMWGGAIGFFQTIWSGIGGAFKAAWTDIIAPILDGLGLLDPIKAAWEGLKSAIGPILDWIAGKFDAAWGLIKPVIDGLKWVIDKGVAVGDAITAATTKPGSPEASAMAQGIMDAPGYAVGGAFRRGPILVGERGPELRFEDRAGFIATNRQLLGMARSASRIAALGGALAAAPVAALPLDGIAPASARASDPAAPAAASGAASQISFGDIVIHAAPGQDPRQIADAVLREIDRRRRGALFDGSE